MDQRAVPEAVTLSLVDLIGAEFTEMACKAQAYLTGEEAGPLFAEAERRIQLFPPAFRERSEALIDRVGLPALRPSAGFRKGAGTASVDRATNPGMAPIGAFGCTRIGEDGRLYFISKSEHYHASLGHAFPGFALLDTARKLGLSNVTHNNTRGYITRKLERELVRAANGLDGDEERLDGLIAAAEPGLLNRVVNLETGSIAVEAALKMMLARFYHHEPSAPKPPYAGRVPVFLVVGDREGGKSANYHGTTILTQTMRGLWHDLSSRMDESGVLRVRPVAINDIQDFRNTVETWDRGANKIAGFFHELVLMNYGAVRLEPAYLREAYEICRLRDIPTMVDEIQSCAWSPQLFLFREYGLKPDFLAVGKGMPGGRSAASRILTTAPMDNLSQFGALVTNGQEEIASLAYLITMAFVRANGPYIQEVGEYYWSRLSDLAERYPRHVDRVEGLRHLASLYFRAEQGANTFVRRLNERCIDISAQAYKEQSPPAALTKLPLVTTFRMVDFLIDKFDSVLQEMEEEHGRSS